MECSEKRSELIINLIKFSYKKPNAGEANYCDGDQPLLQSLKSEDFTCLIKVKARCPGVKFAGISVSQVADEV